MSKSNKSYSLMVIPKFKNSTTIIIYLKIVIVYLTKTVEQVAI